MKILLAEDEADLREVLTDYLGMNGISVDAVENGALAVEQAGRDAYDVYVLDIMMPVMDGIEAMKRIREAGDGTPAIFLTAKAELDDRVLGLETGADDYLTKPFAMKELLARLKALARRRRGYALETKVFGNVTLDAEHALMRAVNEISLSFKEVRLLELFFAHPERSFTSAELLERIWPGESAKEEVVWVYISFLRSKLASIRADVMIEGEHGGTFRAAAAPEKEQ